MGIENSPQEVNPEQLKRQSVERDIYSYIRNIDNVHDMVNDVYGLPLSSDPLFELLNSKIKEDLVPLAYVLFSKARESTGVERQRFLNALFKLKLFTNDYDYLLSTIPTNELALGELERKMSEELDKGNEETFKEKLKRKALAWLHKQMRKSKNRE